MDGDWDPLAMAIACAAVAGFFCLLIFAGEIAAAVKKWRRAR
jgi:hypothetical protein